MSKYTKIALGIAVTGGVKYWTLAINLVNSFLLQSTVLPRRILVATDEDHHFISLSNIFKDTDIHFEKIVPSDFYTQLVPTFKGNYSTYWKFDLFNSLQEDEVLVYLDLDTLVIKKVDFTPFVELFNEGSYKLAAVPSFRPVTERSSILRLHTPFDYFNAGVLIGVSDNRYSKDSLTNSYNKIRKFDSLDLMWHDQDLFNLLFSDGYFKISYNFNLSTGFLLREYEKVLLINTITANDFFKNASIIHFSGNYLSSPEKFHPYQSLFRLYVQKTIDRIEQIHTNIHLLEPYKEALIFYQKKSKLISLDYYLQLLRVRSKRFNSMYYPNIIRITWRVIRRLMQRN